MTIAEDQFPSVSDDTIARHLAGDPEARKELRLYWMHAATLLAARGSKGVARLLGQVKQGYVEEYRRERARLGLGPAPQPRAPKKRKRKGR